MTIGHQRLTVGQSVEVRRVKPGPQGQRVETWENGAKFSHYSSRGLPVVSWPENRIETLVSIEDVRPA